MKRQKYIFLNLFFLIHLQNIKEGLFRILLKMKQDFSEICFLDSLKL